MNAFLILALMNPGFVAHAQPFDDLPPHPRAKTALVASMPELEVMSPDMVIHAREHTESMRRRRRILPIVDRILSIPEDKIDIWKVSLTMAEDTDPNLDLKKYTEDFEAVVAQARRITPINATPDYRIRVLNTLLFRRLGIEYDKTDFMGNKLINRYAYGILKTRRGTCANMATFYIATAQRLGYPIYAVDAPQHTFARYIDPTLDQQNIDPAGQGGWDPDEAYIRKTGIPENAIRSGAYLRTRTNREFAAELIMDHAAVYYAQVLKDYPTAIAIMEKAILASPQSSDHWRLLGEVYKHWAASDSNQEVGYLKHIKGQYFLEKAAGLGVGPPLEDGYWKHDSKKIGEVPGV